MDLGRPILVTLREFVLLLATVSHASAGDTAFVVETNREAAPQSIVGCRVQAIAYSQRRKRAVRILWSVGEDFPNLKLADFRTVSVTKQTTRLVKPPVESSLVDRAVSLRARQRLPRCPRKRSTPLQRTAGFRHRLRRSKATTT